MHPLQFIFLSALVLALALTPGFTRLAHRLGILDHPAHRKVHAESVAYLGGLSIFCAFSAAWAITLAMPGVAGLYPHEGWVKAFLVLGASLGVGAVGLFDDAKNPPMIYKLAGQAAFAFAFAFFGFQFQVLHLPGFHPVSLGLLSVPVTVFWILAVVNAFNMIDGLDGLAASVSLGSLLLIAVAAAMLGNGMELFLTVGLLGAVAGFLPFNWKPAKIYLGDAGSGGLGMFIACALVALGKDFGAVSPPDPNAAQPFHYQFLIATLLVAYPALEVILSVARRWFRGSPIWRADKGHIHHRLQRAGWNAPGICLLALGLTLLPGIAALATLHQHHGWAALILLLYGLLIGLGLSALGFLDFLLPQVNGHQRPHYLIAHHFISMQREKLYLASSRGEILALIGQTCQELGVRSLRLVIPPDEQGLGGMDYFNVWDPDKPAEYLDFIHDSTQEASNTFSDRFKLPEGRGGAYWAFEPHTEEEDLDVEYHVLFSEFMGAALERAEKLGQRRTTYEVFRAGPAIPKKVSGQALRQKYRAKVGALKKGAKKMKGLEEGGESLPPRAAGTGQPVDALELLMLAVQASRSAGKAVLEVYASDFEVQFKGERDPLTLADQKAHQVIQKALSQGAGALFPVLSEEGRDIPHAERKDWDHFWMVDPLDGTKEFLKKNGEFTVNIALVRKGRPILGVVYVPVTKTFYFAAEGFGAFKLEGLISYPSSPKKFLAISQSLSVSPPPPRGGKLRVVASRSHLSAETKDYIEGLKREYEVELVAVGSSLKFCRVAEGKAEAYPRFAPTMEWDTAAGQVVLEQAGGVVLDHGTGQPLRYNKESLVNPWFLAGDLGLLLKTSGKGGG